MFYSAPINSASLNLTNGGLGILLLIIIILVIILSPFTLALFTRAFKGIKRLTKKSESQEEKISITQEVQSAIDSLIVAGKGASIVIDVKNETDEYVIDSVFIDSRISSNILINIFEGSKTPLHDGAVIIKGNRIDRASAYITNLSKQTVPKRFGTRHRSALGLSEVTKAIIIVLSEETGKVRIFYKSKWEDVNQRDLFGRIIDLWV